MNLPSGPLQWGHSSYSYFHNVYRGLDSVFLCASSDCMPVPWEWLRPAQRGTGESLPMLSEIASIVRSSSSIAHTTWKVSNFDNPRSSSSLFTIGLDDDAADQSNRRSISSKDELFEVAEEADVVHLMGHLKRENRSLEVRTRDGGKIGFTIDNFRGRSLCRSNQTVVLSSCGVAADHSELNFGATISSTCDTDVFCPFLTIDDEFAEKFDRVLLTAIHKKPQPVADLLKEIHEELPVVASYVRFGA